MCFCVLRSCVRTIWSIATCTSFTGPWIGLFTWKHVIGAGILFDVLWHVWLSDHFVNKFCFFNTRLWEQIRELQYGLAYPACTQFRKQLVRTHWSNGFYCNFGPVSFATYFSCNLKIQDKSKRLLSQTHMRTNIYSDL